MSNKKISEDSMFFGLELTEEQIDFRDSIYGGNYDIIFCNSKAGTGKTQIAVATAKMLVAEGGFDGLVYIVSTLENGIGFLPGTLEEKIAPYSQPLEDALIKINEMPSKAIKQYAVLNAKNGTSKKDAYAWVDCISHTYLRGVNFENKIIIIDEMQNMYTDQAKKVLTRCHDNCRVICIGHNGQTDLLRNAQNSGFVKYIKHFESQERCNVCTLTKNFRGWLATHADDLP